MDIKIASSELDYGSSVQVVPFIDSLDNFVDSLTLDQLTKMYLSDFAAECLKGNYQSLIIHGRIFLFITLKDLKTPGIVFQTVRKILVSNKKMLGSKVRLNLLELYKSNVDFSLYSEAVIQSYLWLNYSIKKQEKEPFIELFIDELKESSELNSILNKCMITAFSQFLTAEIVNRAPNFKTPEHMLDWSKEVLNHDGIEITTFKREEVTIKGFHALYSVGMASTNLPAVTVATYSNPDAKCTIGLVGKGITFDTGGLSIKNSANMHYMKCDMAGSAAVICAFSAIVKLGLPVNLVLVTPFAENVINGNALKPGDVIDSHAGKSIEIIDTDAEGRLILADALSYITQNYKMDVVVDMATLTGSSVATLGYEAAALFTEDEHLSALLSEAGLKWEEKVWRLPLWDNYREDILSDVADYRNFSGKPVAGAITAAKFLQEFTNNHPSWVHLDIAGVAFKDSEFGKMRNATAYGVMLLVEFATIYCKHLVGK